MMMKWSRFYVSRVDPWVVCKGSKSLENVIVPKKVSLQSWIEKQRRGI
jgi:hypothetical protein